MFCNNCGLNIGNQVVCTSCGYDNSSNSFMDFGNTYYNSGNTDNYNQSDNMKQSFYGQSNNYNQGMPPQNYVYQNINTDYHNNMNNNIYYEQNTSKNSNKIASIIGCVFGIVSSIILMIATFLPFCKQYGESIFFWDVIKRMSDEIKVFNKSSKYLTQMDLKGIMIFTLVWEILTLIVFFTAIITVFIASIVYFVKYILIIINISDLNREDVNQVLMRNGKLVMIMTVFMLMFSPIGTVDYGIGTWFYLSCASVILITSVMVAFLNNYWKSVNNVFIYIKQAIINTLILAVSLVAPFLMNAEIVKNINVTSIVMYAPTEIGASIHAKEVFESLNLLLILGMMAIMIICLSVNNIYSAAHGINKTLCIENEILVRTVFSSVLSIAMIIISNIAKDVENSVVSSVGYVFTITNLVCSIAIIIIFIVNFILDSVLIKTQAELIEGSKKRSNRNALITLVLSLIAVLVIILIGVSLGVVSSGNKSNENNSNSYNYSDYDDYEYKSSSKSTSSTTKEEIRQTVKMAITDYEVDYGDLLDDYETAEYKISYLGSYTPYVYGIYNYDSKFIDILEDSLAYVDDEITYYVEIEKNYGGLYTVNVSVN